MLCLVDGFERLEKGDIGAKWEYKCQFGCPLATHQHCHGQTCRHKGGGKKKFPNIDSGIIKKYMIWSIVYFMDLSSYIYSNSSMWDFVLVLTVPTDHTKNARLKS